MSILFELHPENPQERFLKQAADLIRQGGLVAMPTDSSYAIVAQLDNSDAAERLRKIRGLDNRYNLTILCRDLAEIGHFARVDNSQYRLLKSATPGPWTFILEATKEVPRRVSHPSRKTIGIRVPKHDIALKLMSFLDAPLLSTTLIPKGKTEAVTDAQTALDEIGNQVAAVIDGGACSGLPTTVIDLSGNEPEIIRIGSGDPSVLGF